MTTPAGAIPGLDRYRILRELGRGGQATVHLAEDVQLHRKVALKVFKIAHPGDPGTRLRFIREAEVASKLDHPGICTVFDAGLAGETAYIAMQYLQGESLARRISKVADEKTPRTTVDVGEDSAAPERSSTESRRSDSGRVARSEVLRTVAILEEAARALHVAHEAGVIHRDIKPANIMVEDGDHAVLTDFGLARQEDSDLPTLTRTGELFGTPAYMSPEQLTRQAIHLDRRSDVWSLGATLYECLTRHRPFEAATREQLYMGILSHEPLPARRFNGAIPRDLEVVLETALQKDRDRRYQTALDLAEDLRRVREGESIRARPISAVGKLLRWMRREPAKAVAAMALLLAVAAVGYVAARWPEIERARAADLHARVGVVLAEAASELGHGRPEVACAAFERALALDPSSIEARAGLALAWLRREDPAAAAEVLGAEEPDPRLAWIRSEVLRAQGRHEEAQELERRSGPPRDAMGRFLLGMRAMHRGHAGYEASFGRAVEYFDRAILTAPSPRALYHYEMADAAWHVGDERMCRRAAAALTLNWPRDPRAWTWAGFALKSVDPEQALRHVDKALDLDPGAMMAHYCRGEVLEEMGRREEAEASYLAAIAVAGDFSSAWDRLGVNRKRQGRYEEAAEAFARATELAPEDPLCWHDRGIAAQMLGQLEAAEGFFRRAAAQDPGLGLPWASLVTVLREQDRLDEAIGAGREGIEKAIENSDKAALYDALGTALELRGDIDAALDSYEKALALSPQSSGTWNNYGCGLDRAGRIEDAVTAQVKAVRLDPGNATALRNLRERGPRFRQEGRLDLALRCFEAIADHPEAGPVDHYDHGNALMAVGRCEEAIAAFDAAIALDPGYAEAHCNRGHALARLGRMAEALGSLEKGHALGTQRGGWPYDSAGWVASARHIIELEQRLEEVLAGSTEPRDLEDLAALTEICRRRDRWADGARLWQDAFARDPTLITDLAAGHRFTAARLAARVGTGEDPKIEDPEARAAWRSRALAWLSDELQQLRRAEDQGRLHPRRILSTLERWQRADALAPLRQPQALATLPDDERIAWTALWRAVAELTASLE